MPGRNSRQCSSKAVTSTCASSPRKAASSCAGDVSRSMNPGANTELVVDTWNPWEGGLAQAFQVLKTRLMEEGLFAPELKKPLPFLPRQIALVTSPTGAAVKDFLRLLGQRCPTWKC